MEMRSKRLFFDLFNVKFVIIQFYFPLDCAATLMSLINLLTILFSIFFVTYILHQKVTLLGKKEFFNK